MAFIDDQHDPNFKHYCRVCKKGFMCGRALGGHMRAHGIGDESCNLEEEEDDDPMSDWEDKFGGANKKMYQLRTNPNRLKSCRTCENCGKEFVSWKSFLEHGKCNSDDASESLISSPNSDESGAGAQGNRWSKRKRSARSNVGCSFSSSYPPEEDDDILLAKCLVQLANTVVEFPSAEPEESYSDEERRMPNSYFAPLIKSGTITFDHKDKGVSKGMFECKACKKVFNSHQALGGHRASHKKVKGCYAAKQDHEENNSALAIEDDAIITNNNNEELMIPPPKPTSSLFQFEQGHALVSHVARRKTKVHECSICHRVFASGQALGGHKRCHWITSNAQETSKFHFQDINNINEANNHKPTTVASDKLDLNVPAWAHASGLMRGPPATLTLNVSTDMQLHSGTRCLPGDFHLKKGDDRDSNNANGNVSATTRYAEDEADSNKLIKLSELKEMENSGSSSQWLQVGIGSTAKADTDV